MEDRVWDCAKLVLAKQDGSLVECVGQVRCTATGAVKITATLPGDDLAPFRDDQTITGSTSDGFSVQAEGAYPSYSSYRTDDATTRVEFNVIRCRLAKADASSANKFKVFLKGAGFIVRCKFQFETHSYKFARIDDPNDRRMGTLRLAVETTDPGDLSSLLLLLSLAQRSLVTAPIRESYRDNDLISVELTPDDRPTEATNLLIPWSPLVMASYFTQTMATYGAKKDDYELLRLISYYCFSVADQNAEKKFILAGVAMEAFKFFWALNVAKKKPVIKASTGLIRGFEKAVNAKGQSVLYTFEELLDEACASLGYSATFTFIEDRNALFHTGAPGAYQKSKGSTWAAIKPELVVLYRQIDDILLKILEYKGPILRWDEPEAEVDFS